MRKTLRVFAIVLTLILVQSVSWAEGIDLDSYTYDELTALRQEIDARIREMDRQYAIANADRSISFEETERIVFVNRNVTLTPEVTILKENAPDRTSFVWSSSDPEIASVTQKGNVTALAPGDAVITAAAADNEYIAGTCIIHSALPVTTITIWGPEEPLALNDNPEEAKAALSYSIEPEDAYFQDVTWQSSDEMIAAVDEDGNIQGVNPGTATITAISTEEVSGGREAVRASYKVKVIQEVTEIELAETTLTMTVGRQAKLNPKALPENAEDRSITYTSSDPEVATVDSSGTVTATGRGECDILCEANGGNGISISCHITVTKLISDISLSESSIILPMGTIRTVEAVITPEDATIRDLIWTSSNVYVARVAAGKIEAVSQGNCVITCTTMDGSDLKATVEVHVPTFSIEKDEYVITEKGGEIIPFHRAASDCEIICNTDATCFTVQGAGRDSVQIIPVYAGSGTLTMTNNAAPEDTYEIRITIDNQAVYDEVSYPLLRYTDLMTDPDRYEDKQVSIRGKVLQTSPPEEGEVTFLIGTGGKDMMDQVLQVKADETIIPEEMADGDEIMIYGMVQLERIYSEALETETVIPSILAEIINPQS